MNKVQVFFGVIGLSTVLFLIACCLHLLCLHLEDKNKANCLRSILAAVCIFLLLCSIPASAPLCYIHSRYTRRLDRQRDEDMVKLRRLIELDAKSPMRRVELAKFYFDRDLEPYDEQAYELFKDEILKEIDYPGAN